MVQLKDTLKKFGYPNAVIKEYAKWMVLLRKNQVTLGSLIIVCKEESVALSSISPEAWNELPFVISDVEIILKAEFQYDKINYLMLMMVDPHVHWHVIPRYSKQKVFNKFVFTDSNWPHPPNLQFAHQVDNKTMAALCSHLKQVFQK